MSAPPISIRCECGEQSDVRFGATWTCPACGRRWDTGQIPDGEYEARLRRMRRFRLEPVGFALLAIAVFVPLIAFVDASFVFLAGIASFAFLFLYMPFWRRRVRRAASEAPRWQLRPE